MPSALRTAPPRLLPKNSAGAPCTHQFPDTLTVQTTKIKPMTTPTTTSARSTTIQSPMIVIHRDAQQDGSSTDVEAQTRTESVPETAPPTGWYPPSYQTPLYIDFTSWNRFGGIDAGYGNNGQSVLLDTNDTTDTWSTKWSGLISPKTTTCAARIVGRVRDVSHVPGVPGGFGIGLATLSGDAPDATLTGTAIQFDFGMQGFRTAIYPSDSDHGFEPATLDREWHDVEVVIDQTSHTLTLDGRVVAATQAAGQCGSPVIRVWAGSAEFADFTVTPLD